MTERNFCQYMDGHSIRAEKQPSGCWTGVLGLNAVNGNTHLNPVYREILMPGWHTAREAVTAALWLLEAVWMAPAVKPAQAEPVKYVFGCGGEE